MRIKKGKIKALIRQIDEILATIEAKELEEQAVIAQVNPTHQKSARNLIHYTAFREYDLRILQKKLGHLGLTRFANSESHVKASLLNSKFMLKSLLGKVPTKFPKAGLSIRNGKRLLTRHTKELLGFRSEGRRVRIMVTLPTEAANDYQLVHDMVKAGMNCARINCAHDRPEIWERIIAHVKKAGEAFNRNVKITMDLAGPKIRTGAMTPGPKVRKFTPKKNALGKIVKPVSVILIPEITEESPPNSIPVGEAALLKLTPGEVFNFIDTRKKKRKLKVVSCQDNYVVAYCYKTTYIGTGTMLQSESDSKKIIEVGALPPAEQAIRLRTDDVLTIHRENTVGEPAQFDEQGQLLQPAHISCQVYEVFGKVKQGEPILFDDGKIGGVIESTWEDKFDVRITRAKVNGSPLRAEKGINFPQSDLKINGLTEKDKKDLEFVAQHADVVNFSFVNSKEDVEELLAELRRLEAINQLGIILKIETQRAFDNLEEILLSAMQVESIGVMIARGDLAVETGWDNIGRIQQEILKICGAAHVPVVWATQVLESLAKKGLPSRSEITDATTSLKAECVMLNKGAHILEAIRLLDKILSDMESYQEKNEAMLPQLEKLLK